MLNLNCTDGRLGVNNIKPKEWGGGPCDFSVILVPIGLGFLTALDLGLCRGTLDLGHGLHNMCNDTLVNVNL